MQAVFLNVTMENNERTGKEENKNIFEIPTYKKQFFKIFLEMNDRTTKKQGTKLI